jgi:hypothetical protein
MSDKRKCQSAENGGDACDLEAVGYVPGDGVEDAHLCLQHLMEAAANYFTICLYEAGASVECTMLVDVDTGERKVIHPRIVRGL